MEYDSRRRSARLAFQLDFHLQSEIGNRIVPEIYQLTRTCFGVMPAVFQFPNRFIVGAFFRIFGKGLFIGRSHVARFHKAETSKIDRFLSRVFQTQNPNALLRLNLSDERFNVRFVRLYLGKRTTDNRPVIELYADFFAAVLRTIDEFQSVSPRLFEVHEIGSIIVLRA